MTIATAPSSGHPVIGILMDWQGSGSFSPRPHYAIREAYFRAVWEAGGLPIGLPLMEEALTLILAQARGVVIPGGDYPSPARWYGEHAPEEAAGEHPRTVVNERIINGLIAQDMPFLAICAGHQELAAATGGLLYWRVKDCVKGAMNHRGTVPTEACHSVMVTPGSLLHTLVGRDEIMVNSHHNEAVKHVNGGVVVSGVAGDGVIEAIEVPGKRFALGVQWHPEFGLSDADHALFAGLVGAARAA